ncbi:MAG: urease accessory protein UreE [Aliishimia sp.]
MTAPHLAQTYHDHAHGKAVGEVCLTYDDRFLRRKVLQLVGGGSVLVDLPQTTSLDHGGVLVLENGGEITVTAAAEPLLDVRGDALHRLAWHIGNRHTPCQIEDTRLLIQRDHVIRDMLQRLGADLLEVTEPFTPEGGAYGHGRTHSHEHGASTHTHPHSHEH